MGTKAYELVIFTAVLGGKTSKTSVSGAAWHLKPTVSDQRFPVQYSGDEVSQRDETEAALLALNAALDMIPEGSAVSLVTPACIVNAIRGGAWVTNGNPAHSELWKRFLQLRGSRQLLSAEPVPAMSPPLGGRIFKELKDKAERAIALKYAEQLMAVIEDFVAEIDTFYMAYLTGGRSLEAITKQLCDAILPVGGILDVESREGGRIVAASFEHKPRKNPAVKNARLFDVGYFFALALFALSGGRFRFKPNTRTGKLYQALRFESPSNKRPGKRITVARIIKNTNPGDETPFAEDHHSYCWAALDVESAAHRVSDATFGRQDARDLACELFAQRYRDADALVRRYNDLLSEVFDLADRMHAQPKAFGDDVNLLTDFKLPNGKPLPAVIGTRASLFGRGHRKGVRLGHRPAPREDGCNPLRFSGNRSREISGRPMAVHAC